MPQEFEINKEIVVEATPEQVWDAIATGPGINSWFVGQYEIEPREGSTMRMTMGDFSSESTVTAWEPAKRFAFRNAPGEDGRYMAFEFLIEGRDQSSTVVRFAHSGMLGDDWEAEYDALGKGDIMYIEKLAAYLKHFAGRPAAYRMMTPGPQVADKGRVWAAFTGAFGLAGTAAVGDQARLTVEGLTPVSGTVEFVSSPTYLGVRAGDGLFALLHGFQDTVVVEFDSFGEVDEQATERAWQDWLTRSFS